MRKEYVEHYKLGFENDPACWKSFGASLVIEGSPNSCRRSSIVQKALRGECQEAYSDWLALREYWTQEEVFVGFILAGEAIIHRRSSAPVPDLPNRVWDDAEYRKWLRQYDDDEFWFHICDRLKTPETTPWLRQRNQFIELLGDGKAREAEAFYYAHDWDQYAYAESDLALIHMCSFVLGDWKDNEEMWFYADECFRLRGPVHEQEIKSALESGRLMPITCVCNDGGQDWQQAVKIPRFSLISTGAQTPPLPTPSCPGSRSEWLQEAFD